MKHPENIGPQAEILPTNHPFAHRGPVESRAVQRVWTFTRSRVTRQKSLPIPVDAREFHGPTQHCGQSRGIQHEKYRPDEKKHVKRKEGGDWVVAYRKELKSTIHR